MGSIKSYGVNTYQGIVRNYNEDRVSIIINMNKLSNTIFLIIRHLSVSVYFPLNIFFIINLKAGSVTKKSGFMGNIGKNVVYYAMSEK